jgi:putative salt-induced outer membrane protein
MIIACSKYHSKVRRNVMVKHILLCTLFIVFRSYSFAHDPEPPPPRTCTGAAEFAFVSTSGNTDTQTIGLGGSVECKPGLWTYLAKAAFIRNETDDIESARSLDTLFRGSRELTPKLKAYGQFGYYQNEFAGIENRYALEGGLSYLLYSNPKHSLEVDGGIGYTNEDRVPVLVPVFIDEDLSFATARIGGIYRWKISENAEFGEDAGFTLNLNDGDDWRFANAVYIAAKINTIFSLKLTNTLSYLNNPVPGFEKTDTVTSAAIVAKF